MKKIKSIKQLKTEKKRIKQQQAQLEHKIRTDWKDVKESLRPVNIAKETINDILKSREESTEQNILKRTFNYGISLVTRKIAEKTKEKINKFFKK